MEKASDSQSPPQFDHSIRRLNLNLLYSLNAILSAPSLTSAGSMIALTQPAMSLALRKLRDYFGNNLVIYGGGEPRLTPLGVALRPRVARMLRDINDLWSLETSFDPSTARRSICLTAPEPIEIMYLSRVVPLMLREGQELGVRLLPFDFGSNERLFSRGADVAIVPETMVDRSLPFASLVEVGLSCLVWKDHPTIGKQMTLADYRNARHAALTPSMDQQGLMGDAMHPLAVERRIVAHTNSYAALPNLVVGSDLVVTISDWLAQYLAFFHPLRVVSVPFAVQRVTLFAQWERHRQDDPLIHWIVAKMLETRDALFARAP